MAELTPLHQALVAPLPATQIIARRGDILLTRDDLMQRARQWAATLQALPQQECALYSRDGFEFLSILLGAWQAGKRVWLPGDTQPATCAKLREHVDLFVGEFPGDNVLLAPDSADYPFRALPPEQEALMVFTSGSTGTPSAIPKTLRQLVSEVAAMQAQWGAAVGEVPVLASVPHQHFYGLLFKVLWPFSRGAAFEACSVDYPEQVCAALQRMPMIWIGSPALMRRLPSDLAWPVENLHLAFCSGGPLPLDAAQQFVQLFRQWPREVYGSSETGAVATRTQETAPAFWRGLPGTQIRRDAESGQLLVSAPWLRDEQPWLMADRGEVQSDGGFTLLGRVDRIVKVAEKRISLDAMEGVLNASPSVRESRLIQFPEGRLGAVVILSPQGEQILQSQGRAALIEILRQSLEQAVERVALPRRWRFVADFPRNALGKITGAALLALFADNDARPRLPVIQQEAPVAENPQQILFELFIPPDLIYFDGHFPGAPILPGVAQIDWAVQFARRCFPVQGTFQGMTQIKFQQVIQPGAVLQLTLTHVPEKSAVDFRYQSAVGPHSSGRIVFGNA